MADTFEQTWKTVLLHCPLAGPFLAQSWVRNAYRKVCEYGSWSWLIGQSEILISASRVGTVSLVRGSSTVTGVGLTFAASDVDRQFRGPFAGIPYTVRSVDTGTNTAVLDRSYANATDAAATGTLFSAYVTMPADFGHFIAVLNPANSWMLHLWVTQGELNLWDPRRMSSGMPYCLANRMLESDGAYDGRVQYELWPYQMSDANYPFYYIRRPPDLVATSEFRGPLRQRADILINLALAEASMWPGTEGRKNPYFNLPLSDLKTKQAMADVARLEVNDQDTFLTWLDQTGIRAVPFAPLDSNYLQSHDV